MNTDGASSQGECSPITGREAETPKELIFPNNCIGLVWQMVLRMRLLVGKD